MLNKSKYIALICGATAMVMTIIFYLLTFQDIFSVPMRWLSLLFLLLSETIGTIKAFTIKRTVLGVSNITVSIVHIIAVLTVSIIFVNIFPFLLKTYMLLNILFICILLVLDVVLVFFAEHVAMQNDKLSQSQAVMWRCVEKAASLCVEFNDTDYRRDLDEIVELLKYSDNSYLAIDEITIMNKLEEVQLLLKSNDDGVAEKIIEIKNTIKLRSVKMASAKRGSY